MQNFTPILQTPRIRETGLSKSFNSFPADGIQLMQSKTHILFRTYSSLLVNK